MHHHFVKLWYHPKFRVVFFQGLFFIALFILVSFFWSNLQENLQQQKIATGFHFLWQEASFELSESLIPFTSKDHYIWAFVSGLINTIKVSLISVLGALLLGIISGIFALSEAKVVRYSVQAFVEFFRNTPLLLQLYFIYEVLLSALPSVRQAYQFLPGFFLCNRGIYFPFFVDGSFSVPALKGFNFAGGASLSPEFLALSLGLVLYTGAFISEIVRAGILSIDKGQWEASSSLGLNSWQKLRFVILPQTLKVVIPPTTSQILNLMKNSSLAVSIGYPDIVSVTNTTLNQTGQAIECIAIMMSVYLTLSLGTSAFMNWYNKKSEWGR